MHRGMQYEGSQCGMRCSGGPGVWHVWASRLVAGIHRGGPRFLTATANPQQGARQGRLRWQAAYGGTRQARQPSWPPAGSGPAAHQPQQKRTSVAAQARFFMKMVREPLAADTSTAAPSEPFCFLAAGFFSSSC